MGFKEEMQKLSVQIAERRDHVINEEMGKQALIIPFLQVLGFDVFNPIEVKPEYIADFGRKKGEKVDYAVFKNGVPILFIEAKALTEKLENYDGQLARYFNSTPEVKLVVITNGVEYKFFTDLDKYNIMDDNPFLITDLTNLSNSDFEVLYKFRKECFETESLTLFAEELTYTSNLTKALEELFKNPTDDFVRLLIKPFTFSKITANVIDRFRPIVKKSISTVLLKMVSQGLFPPEDITPPPEEITLPKVDDKPKIEPEKAKPVTTEEELRAFETVKDVLINANHDVSSLSYKDTLNYFGIHNRNIFNWFLRLSLGGPKKYLILRLPFNKVSQNVPDFTVEEAGKAHGESSRIYIDSIEDIAKLGKLIIECFDDIVQTAKKI